MLPLWCMQRSSGLSYIRLPPDLVLDPWEWRRHWQQDSTSAYNYLSAALLSTWVAGAAIGAMLLSHHVWLLNSLSIICYVVTACLATTIPGSFGKDGGDRAAIHCSPDERDDPRLASVSEIKVRSAFKNVAGSPS